VRHHQGDAELAARVGERKELGRSTCPVATTASCALREAQDLVHRRKSASPFVEQRDAGPAG
jgi:hypothetical protein